MTKPNTTMSERTAFGDPIVQLEDSSFQIQTGLERGNLTIIIKVEIPRDRRAHVDRDRDFFLCEFMEAQDV